MHPTNQQERRFTTTYTTKSRDLQLVWQGRPRWQIPNIWRVQGLLSYMYTKSKRSVDTWHCNDIVCNTTWQHCPGYCGACIWIGRKKCTQEDHSTECETRTKVKEWQGAWLVLQQIQGANNQQPETPARPAGPDELAIVVVRPDLFKARKRKISELRRSQSSLSPARNGKNRISYHSLP